MRLTVTLDEKLLSEAKKLSHAASKREAIELALKEFVRRKKLEEAAKRAGKVDMAVTVGELLRQRAEE